MLTLTGPGVFTSSYRRHLRESTESDIVEAGIDFHGTGMFRIPGSIKSIKTTDHYSTHRDEVIVSAAPVNVKNSGVNG